jgi:hypothetical protein
MKAATLQDALDLDAWANRREAEALFPELVRRLIRATKHDILPPSFPSGEGVRQHGPTAS